jgi:hypothetical protein
MQRIGLLLVGLATLGTGRGYGQQAAGTALWRVAATTVPVPLALARGPAATFWNPAQTDDSGAPHTQVAIEAIQTPAAIGAAGMLAAVRLPVRSVGYLGIVYGRVGLSDLMRTVDSPDPTGSVIPVYTFALGATWSRLVGATSIGATLAFHETRIDATRADRWTIDVGASRAFAGDRLRVAAATHFFSSLTTTDPAQDLYAGIEARLWEGPLWGDRALLRARYGLAFGHGFTADHQVGLGVEVARVVALDVAVVREGSYGSDEGWRPIAGVRVTMGKYRVTLARDAGMNQLGSAYRVGVDARFR